MLSRQRNNHDETGQFLHIGDWGLFKLKNLEINLNLFLEIQERWEEWKI